MILRRDSLDDVLDRIEHLYQDGELEKAEKELRRGRRKYPGDLVLIEWEATFAADAGRFADALAHLESVLAVEPGRPFALREKVSALIGLGRFEEALALLGSLGAQTAGDAAYHYDLGLCLDRLGRPEEADRAFKKAARLDPEGFPRPARLSGEEFDAVVQASLEAVPEALRSYLENVVVEA